MIKFPPDPFQYPYIKYGEKTPLFKAGMNRRVFGNN